MIKHSAKRTTSVPRYVEMQSPEMCRECIFVTDGTNPHLAEETLLTLEKHRENFQVRQTVILQNTEIAPFLKELLNDGKMGVRVVALGTETFMWEVQRCALGSGLGENEIQLIGPPAKQQRTIYCAHCSSVQVNSGEPETRCEACGVQLEVRAHFSRRLGAYLGVCLDADQPFGASSK